METSLHGRRALVTGAASGIGAAIAEAFAREGAHVAVHARSEERARPTVDAIEAAGGRAFAAVADLRDRAAIARMCEAAIERLGGLDILVNNAGNLCYQAGGRDGPRELGRHGRDQPHRPLSRDSGRAAGTPGVGRGRVRHLRLLHRRRRLFRRLGHLRDDQERAQRLHALPRGRSRRRRCPRQFHQPRLGRDQDGAGRPPGPRRPISASPTKTTTQQTCAPTCWACW